MKHIHTPRKILFTFLYVFFLFFLHIQHVFSQEDSLKYYYEYDTIIVKKKIKKIKFAYQDYKKGEVDFYISPLGLFEPSSTIYLGIEYFLKDKISIYTDLGYILNFKETRNNTDFPLPHSSYISYVIKPEIRFYTKNNPQKASYHALKLMFRNMNYKENQFVYDDYFYDSNTDSWTVSGEGYEADYRVRRRSIGIQYIRGWKGKIPKKWTHNFYCGVGVRYISNRPIDKQPTPFGDGWELFQIDYLDLEKQYKMVSMDFSVGIRLGTKLKTKN